MNGGADLIYLGKFLVEASYGENCYYDVSRENNIKHRKQNYSHSMRDNAVRRFNLKKRMDYFDDKQDAKSPKD